MAELFRTALQRAERCGRIEGEGDRKRLVVFWREKMANGAECAAKGVGVGERAVFCEGFEGPRYLLVSRGW